MGNPHAVAFVDSLDDAGRLFDAPGYDADVYPDGVNVEFVVRRGERHVAMRVHERGSGETRSCGTGACAVMVAAAVADDHRPAGTDVAYRVDVPGGTLTVTWTADDRVAAHRACGIVACGAEPTPDRQHHGEQHRARRGSRGPSLGAGRHLTSVLPMDISGSTAIVTGAASGIGAACARQLAARGATVVVADLQADKGEALAAEIKGVFAQVDVTNTEQITAAVNAAAEIAPLRAVVNSAGIGWAQRTIGRDGQIESAHDLDAFKRVIAINLIGTFDMVRQAATVMSRNEPDADGQRGAIVNLASVAAFDGQIGQASYSASKGGVVGMTLPVARDLSASGIRLNTIAPGLVDTPIYGEGPESEAFKAKLGESVLFPKRLGVPDELASMVIELPHQLVHERRGDPRRRRHQDAAEVGQIVGLALSPSARPAPRR